MNTRQIRSALTVHQHGSIQKAAKILHLAPSSVSAQLKELSAELGVELFSARGRNIVLSDIGRSLLPSFQAFIAQERAIVEQAQRAGQLLDGSLTLFAPSSICIYRLPRIIERLQQLAPNLELLLTHEPFDYENALAVGEIDAAIIIPDVLSEAYSELQETWSYQRLSREDVIYVSHPKRYQPNTLSLEELTQQPVITTEPTCTYRIRASAHFAKKGLLFEPRQSFTNVEVVKRCVLANMGIGLLTRCSVEAELGSGQLVEQKVEGAPYAFESCIIARRETVMSPKLSVLWDVIEHLNQGV